MRGVLGDSLALAGEVARGAAVNRAERRLPRRGQKRAEMADHVVWLPTNSAGCDLRGALEGAPGALVSVTKEALA